MKINLKIARDESHDGISYNRLANFIQDVFSFVPEESFLKHEAKEIMYLLEAELQKTIKEKNKNI